jgi:hypothetical protein
MEKESYNILERIVAEKVNEAGASTGPRILVRRRSLLPAEMGHWFDDVIDQPGYPVSKMKASECHRDWKSAFRLDIPANQVERDVVELDFSYYSPLLRDAHSRILFSFSTPVSANGSSLLYGIADRGFLWAHGFLCRFEGAFDSPTEFEFLNVWRS